MSVEDDGDDGSFLQIDFIPAVPFETGEANEMDTFAKVACLASCSAPPGSK